MNNVMLEINNISKIYTDGKRSVKALDDVSLKFSDKGFIFVNGISGSGKTTLMNILVGIDKPTSGKIFFNGKDLTECADEDWAEYRNLSVGIVFQNFNLIDDMTVKDNLLLPLKIQEFDLAEYEKQLNDALKYVGLEDYQDRLCMELSAGQKQRIALARALIKNPGIILADEATGNLDPLNTDVILDLLNDISKDHLVILISHDRLSANRYGDRIITLSDGHIIGDVDNRKIKNLFEENYVVSVENCNASKEVRLDSFDLEKEIVQTAEWDGSVFDPIDMKLHIEYREEDQKKEIRLPVKESLKSRRLSFKEIINNSLFFVRKRKMKTFITVCLIMFISSLLHLGMIATFNDYSRAIVNYIKTTEYDLVPVKRVITTDEGDMTLNKGKAFLNDLKSGVNNNVIRSIPDNECLFPEDDEPQYVSVLAADDLAVLKGMKYEGDMPKRDDQVLMNSFTAQKHHVDIGDVIEINGVKCEISGLSEISSIIEGDYVITVSSSVFDSLTDSQMISLQGTDITLSADKTNYAYSICSLSPASVLSEEKLLWGRLPGKAGEFVISSELASLSGDAKTGDFIRSYRLPDLYDEKYEGKFGDAVNLFDHTGKKVEIVGVFDSETFPDYGSIIVEDEVYKNILNDYISYLNFDNCYIPVNGEFYDYVRNMMNDNYKVADEVCAYIYSFNEITKSSRHMFYAAVSVFVVMLIFALISFLTYNVKDHARRIGIFRVLGVESRDVELIFTINSMMVCMLSVILSSVNVLIITDMFNNNIDGVSRGTSFDMFVIDPVRLITLSLLIVLLSVLVTVIPLKKMFKERTIVLLNE